MIVRKIFPDRRVCALVRDGATEYFITVASPAGTDPGGAFEAALAAVAEDGATVLAQDVFAPLRGGGSGTARADWPVTAIESGHGRGSPLAGTYVHAIRGVGVNRIELGGRVVGSWFDDAHARYCRLGGVYPSDLSAPPPEQARQVFEAMEEALRAAGMDLRNVVRTGMYLDNLLAWYGAFNRVRSAVFRERGIVGRLAPASTGISGANPAGAAIVANALAVAPRTGEFNVVAVDSPMQCSAMDYGSSFSRAVELVSPSFRRLLVSGTASIAPSGETVHADDIGAQVELTMRVAGTILESRNMTWADTARCVAYCKQAGYASAFSSYCRANGLGGMPVIVTENHICRDDLLFEIELDAISAV